MLLKYRTDEIYFVLIFTDCYLIKKGWDSPNVELFYYAQLFFILDILVTASQVKGKTNIVFRLEKNWK